MRLPFGCLIVLLAMQLPAQPPQVPVQPPARQPHTRRRNIDPARPNPPFVGRVAQGVDDNPVVTHHEIHTGGKTLNHAATAAQMPLRNSNGNGAAHIVYMGYALDGVADAAQRPVTFCNSGGPGTASMFVHKGAMGPRPVSMLPNGGLPPPPYKIVDNEDTWIDFTDLVFIDPVGTGYSRAAIPE